MELQTESPTIATRTHVSRLRGIHWRALWVWTTLYDAQLPIPGREPKSTFKVWTLWFEREKIPVIKEVNQRLKAATGWEVFIVPGLIDDKPFFEFLAAKKFQQLPGYVAKKS